jgi:hypothetical protein
MPIERVCLLACAQVLLAVALAGCHDASTSASRAASPAQPPAEATPSASASALAELLEGTVTIEQVDYSFWGWLTADGTLRLNINRPSAAIVVDEVYVDDVNAGIAQIVGTLGVSGTSASGNGVMIGEGCSSPTPFCDPAGAPQGALVVLRRTGATDTGTGLIRVTTSRGDEFWSLALEYWGSQGFQRVGDVAIVPGLYGVRQPEITPNDSAVMNVDDQGRLFFQSAETGCTGNGAIEPLRGADNGLYRVTLTIDDCTGALSYLNGDLVGLSDMSLSLPWEGDGRAIYEMLLSTAPGASSSSVAIVLTATQQ